MIRTLLDHDAEAYVELRRAALLDSPLAFASSPGDDFASSPEAVREHLRRAPSSVILGAFQPDLIGVIGIFRDHHAKASHKAHIWGLYVVPGHRGQGIAAGLLEAALRHARSLGVEWVHLGVTEAAPAARRLYERAGFEVWGIEPEALRHEGQAVAEAHMALRLLRGSSPACPVPPMHHKILSNNDSEREHAMSQPAVAALAPLPFELVLDDGEPLETEWHVMQLPLLRGVIRQAMLEQGRTDFYTGTNQFVYFSIQQAREVAEEVEKGLEQRAFRGPDVFWVGGVDPAREREIWIAWEEDGRLPDVIVELLSPSTAKKDRTEKRDLYERVFGTAEYLMHDPETRRLEALRLVGSSYKPIVPNAQGRFWSEQLQVYFGVWHGVVEHREDHWVRLYRPDGSLVPTAAEAERQRADAAEAELARLRALLEDRDKP